jgi:hypothetical protein
MPDRIDDLVLQDSRQPGLDARPARESLARSQRRNQRFLDDVFGCVGVAELQLCNAQQIAAVTIELGGEKRSVQRGPRRSAREGQRTASPRIVAVNL